MSDLPLTILLAGGGTGGHLYPGIAVAEALREALPNAHPLFLTTSREIDRVILSHTDFEHLPQPILPLPSVADIGGLLRFWKSWRETKEVVRSVLRARKPAAVLGLGGYAAGVAVKMAADRAIPTAVLNPDVVPGKANKYLMRSVRAVCTQFEATADHVNSPDLKNKLHVTGCPIRADIQMLPRRDEAARRLGLDPMLHTLVVTGASLGARTINEAIVEMFRGVTLNGWQVLHLTGRDHAESVRKSYREIRLTGVLIVDFTPAMSDVWAVADLAVSRSGASSCAELTSAGVPSILMPYPFHKDMHQRLNAKVLADAGAAVLVDDQRNPRANAEKLRPAMQSLLYDLDARRAMAEAAKKLGKPGAAAAVARVLSEMIGVSR